MDSSYTNSFGQFGDSVSSSNSGASNGVGPIMSAPSEPAMSGGGDVVLAPSGSAKKKRWPLVVGIVLILIAIGAGVGIAFNNNVTSKVDCSNSFNRVLNYVLYGNDSIASLSGEYTGFINYKIGQIGDESGDIEYLKNLKKLVNGAEDVCARSEINQQIKNEVRQYLGTVNAYVETSLLGDTEYDVVLMVEKNGENYALENIEKYFSSVVSSQYQDIAKIGRNLVTGMGYYVKYVGTIVEETDCMVSALSDECLDIVADVENNSEDFDNATSFFNEAIGSANYQIRIMIPQSWIISDDIKETQ